MIFILKGKVKCAIELNAGLSDHIDHRRMELLQDDSFRIMDQVFNIPSRVPIIEFNQEDTDFIISVLNLTGCLDTALTNYVDYIRNYRH